MARGRRGQRTKEVPRARTARRGRVSRRLEDMADLFRQNNEKYEVRYVYDPQSRPDMSNVVSRLADGYTLVTQDDFPDEVKDQVDYFFDEKGKARVGDLVLMKISKPEKRELQQERDEIAQERKKLVSEKYYEEMQSEDPRLMKPRGKASIQQREVEMDYEQQSSED